MTTAATPKTRWATSRPYATSAPPIRKARSLPRPMIHAVSIRRGADVVAAADGMAICVVAEGTGENDGAGGDQPSAGTGMHRYLVNLKSAYGVVPSSSSRTTS